MQHGTLVTLCGSQAVLVDGIDLSVYMYIHEHDLENFLFYVKILIFNVFWSEII